MNPIKTEFPNLLDQFIQHMLHPKRVKIDTEQICRNRRNFLMIICLGTILRCNLTHCPIECQITK